MMDIEDVAGDNLRRYTRGLLDINPRTPPFNGFG